MFKTDKSGCYTRDERLVKAAVEMKKTAKKDNSKVQENAARKLYKSSSVY
jgi:hypothetical protein